MYRSIDKSHAKYVYFKRTSEEVSSYLKQLATECIDHDEYNPYKHGLRCFPGLGTLRMISDETNETVMHSKSNMIECIAFKDEVIDKQLHQRVMITDKTFDYMRDSNTAVLKRQKLKVLVKSYLQMRLELYPYKYGPRGTRTLDQLLRRQPFYPS